MKNPGVPLALFAGLIGGIFSQYVGAQIQTKTATPKVVAAQTFVLVDDKGKPAGAFAVGRPLPKSGNAPSIVLYDVDGREIWRASGNAERLMTAQ